MSERLSAEEREALLRRADDACRPCGPCDSGLPMGCTCDPEPRAVIAGLLEILADRDARLAAERAEGVNDGIRLAAELVKGHALGGTVTPSNVVEFLIARADRAALHPDPSPAQGAGDAEAGK